MHLLPLLTPSSGSGYKQFLRESPTSVSSGWAEPSIAAPIAGAAVAEQDDLAICKAFLGCNAGMAAFFIATMPRGEPTGKIAKLATCMSPIGIIAGLAAFFIAATQPTDNLATASPTWRTWLSSAPTLA